MAYEWEPGMGEISGFGGGYEELCRKIVKQGMEWWDAHPDADPKYKGFQGVFGLVMDENEDAKQLDLAMMSNGAGEGATGAMHQACLSAIFYIHKNGWEKYKAEMSKREMHKESRADA